MANKLRKTKEDQTQIRDQILTWKIQTGKITGSDEQNKFID